MASDQKCGDTATRASSQLHGCTLWRLSAPEGRSHVATSHAPTGAHSLTSQPLALRTCSWRRFHDPASSWSVFMTVASLGNENYFVLSFTGMNWINVLKSPVPHGLGHCLRSHLHNNATSSATGVPGRCLLFLSSSLACSGRRIGPAPLGAAVSEARTPGGCIRLWDRSCRSHFSSCLRFH